MIQLHAELCCSELVKRQTPVPLASRRDLQRRVPVSVALWARKQRLLSSSFNRIYVEEERP